MEFENRDNGKTCKHNVIPKSNIIFRNQLKRSCNLWVLSRLLIFKSFQIVTMMLAWSSFDPLFLSRLFCIQSRLSLQQQQHSIYKKLSNFSVWTTFSFLSNLRSYHPTLSTRQVLVVELQKTTVLSKSNVTFDLSRESVRVICT